MLLRPRVTGPLLCCAPVQVLTLASNERIALTPSMRLLFEIHHLGTATPATVSRAGVLYVNPQDLGWNPWVLLCVQLWWNVLNLKSATLIIFQRTVQRHEGHSHCYTAIARTFFIFPNWSLTSTKQWLPSSLSQPSTHCPSPFLFELSGHLFQTESHINRPFVGGWFLPACLRHPSVSEHVPESTSFLRLDGTPLYISNMDHTLFIY